MLVTRRSLLQILERGEKELPLGRWAQLLLDDDPEEYRDRPYAPEPTCLDPGSEAKISLMERRVAAGCRPCHPGDLDMFNHEHMQRQAEVLNNGRRRLKPLELRTGRASDASASAGAQKTTR